MQKKTMIHLNKIKIYKNKKMILDRRKMITNKFIIKTGLSLGSPVFIMSLYNIISV